MTPAVSHSRVGTDSALQTLLRAIFGSPDAQTLFVVLRNGERLPDTLAGTDLDLSVLPGQSLESAVEYIRDKGQSVGWETVCVSARPHMVGLSLLNRGDAPGRGVHFDIFDGITLFCIPLLTRELLLAESVVHHGVRQLSVRGQALATVVHHLAWSGSLSKDKYTHELEQVLAEPDDRRWLLTEVERVFGARIRRELELGRSLRGRRNNARRRLAMRGAILRAARRDVAATLRSVTRYWRGQVESAMRPPGIVGVRGARIGSNPGRPLDLELACMLSPHGFHASHVRADSNGVLTLNGPRYVDSLRTTWRRWCVVRWLAPAAFLWFQAKRGRVVVLDRLPWSMRTLRALGPGRSFVAVRER